MSKNARVSAVLLTAFLMITASPSGAQVKQNAGRLFQPEDLFRVWQIGATRWSPDGRLAAIQVFKPGNYVDTSVPTGEMRILDISTQTTRTISTPSAAYMGYFNPIWSPDGKRLAFLSVDSDAVVRPWIWTLGAGKPKPLDGIDVRLGTLDNPIVWIGNESLALVAWDIGAEKSGPLYHRVTRGRKVADGWKQAVEMKTPTVSVLESGGAAADPPKAHLLSVDIRTGARRELARGGIHRLSASADGRFLAFRRNTPGLRAVQPYFALESVDDAYDAVAWGMERHVIDTKTGVEVDPSSMSPATPTGARPAPAAIPPPRPGARLLSRSPAGDGALFVTNDSEGTSVWLVGGGGRPLTSASAIWRANEWVREIKTGATEQISYKSMDGKQLTAWLLLPPDYTPGKKIPIVTVVYPGRTYGATVPPGLSVLQPHFEHPQLFAALGYGVLLPSMPEQEDSPESRSLPKLANGVLPAIDAIVERGIADGDRVAVLGQSDGGFAVLGLITQTNRFRSAIASAGFSNLVSLYGTLYGNYRYGDTGPTQTSVLLRVLQLEKGYGGLGGPPWSYPDRYREGSAVLQANKVSTPLMLVHGDLDFIPVQQSEEFFTALYRQGKRAVFLRYQGEWHTIDGRANVLDLWRRIGAWLTETMAPRR